jgi:hypothetical protein
VAYTVGPTPRGVQAACKLVATKGVWCADRLALGTNGVVVRVWLLRWAIVLIVVASLGASAVVSYVIVDAGESLTAVLTGDILIASVSIFLAAVAAALYAKPAYDAATASLRKDDVKLVRLSVDDGATEIEPEGDGEPRVFVVSNPQPCTVIIKVQFFSIAEHAKPMIFNFQVPAGCEIQPKDNPLSGHYEVYGTTLSPLVVEGEFVPARLTRAESVIYPRVNKSYSVEVTLPYEPSLMLGGWPMRAVVRGLNDKDLALDERWWVTPLAPRAREPSETNPAPSLRVRLAKMFAH